MHAVLVAGLCVSYVRVPACALGTERAAASKRKFWQYSCSFCLVRNPSTKSVLKAHRSVRAQIIIPILEEIIALANCTQKHVIACLIIRTAAKK